MKARLTGTLGATALAGALLLSPMASSAFAAEASETPQISVTGEGQVSVAPDQAMLQLSVTRTAETAAAALSANNGAMRDVLAALKADGIADRDLQTSDVSIYPQYNQPEMRNNKPIAPVIVGYQVSNGVTVRVRDLTKLGSLIDKTVKLGVNQGGQVSFINENPKAALNEARRKAVQDAMEKARLMAEAAGTELGPILSIEENNIRPMPAMPAPRMMAKEMAADSVPIASGENTYNVAVQVRFKLGK